MKQSISNSWLFFFPDGMEGIVVSGQPGDHKNKRHFLVNGLDRAKKLQKQYKKDGKGEGVTWMVYNNGNPNIQQKAVNTVQPLINTRINNYPRNQQ